MLRISRHGTMFTRVAPRLGFARTNFGTRMSRSTGVSTVELVAGLVVLIPVVLTLFDIGCIISAVQVNDTICRDVTRAVAAGEPATAPQRARNLLEQSNKAKGSVVSNYVLVGDPINTNLVVPRPEVGGLVKGTVTVRTRVDVKPPFLIGAVYSGNPLKFDSEQTFPYTYVVPVRGEDPN